MCEGGPPSHLVGTPSQKSYPFASERPCPPPSLPANSCSVGHGFAAHWSRAARFSNANPEQKISYSGSPMPIVQVRAFTILGEFEQAQAELVGKAVVLADGKAGTVESVCLDELHGLRISIRGHDGRWPVSTIKLVQTS